MGLFKSLYTELHSSSYPGRKTRILRLAAKAEAAVRNQIEMSFATEAEFRDYLMRADERRWSKCTACPLKDNRTNVVFGQGVMEPLLMVVGEAPGEHEDMTGLPFQGQSGALLRKACASLEIDLPRDAWITNTVCCRPPKNRNPETRERAACEPRLRGQVEILQPYVLLLLGKQALKWCQEVGRDPSLSDWRGLIPRENWPSLGRGAVNLKAVFSTYHPSYILRCRNASKGQAKQAVQRFGKDLRDVKRVLDVLNRKVERTFLEESRWHG